MRLRAMLRRSRLAPSRRRAAACSRARRRDRRRPRRACRAWFAPAPETWCRTCRLQSRRPSPAFRRPRAQAAWRGDSPRSSILNPARAARAHRASESLQRKVGGRISLAHGARDKNLGGAIGARGSTALEQEPPGFALLLGPGVEALAGRKALPAAKRHGRCLAVGSAVLRRDAWLARLYHPRIRQSDHRGGRIPGGLAGLIAQLVEGLLSVLHIALEAIRAFIEPTAQSVDKASLLRGRAWRRLHGGRRNIGRRTGVLAVGGAHENKRTDNGHGRDRHVSYAFVKVPPPETDHSIPVVAPASSLRRSHGESEEPGNTRECQNR